MKITSKQVKFVKEFDSSNGGNRSMIPIGDFLKVPLEIPDPEDTKIFRCYDKNKKLLGKIRPKKNDKIYDIKFTMSKEIDFITAPCNWTEKDAEYVADYEVLRKLGMKNVKKRDIKK